MPQNLFDENNSRSNPALEGCLIVLERFRSLREKTDPEDYIKKTGLHSSIGEHIRHCLDYMISLKLGVQDGAVDYDKRIRHKPLETNSEILYKTIDEITLWLNSLENEDLKLVLTIQEMSVTGAPARPAQSSLERELVFQASHSVHHLAIIVLIAEIIGTAVPYDFGVAPSTLFFRSLQKRSA